MFQSILSTYTYSLKIVYLKYTLRMLESTSNTSYHLRYLIFSYFYYLPVLPTNISTNIMYVSFGLDEFISRPVISHLLAPYPLKSSNSSGVENKIGFGDSIMQMLNSHTSNSMILLAFWRWQTLIHSS